MFRDIHNKSLGSVTDGKKSFKGHLKNENRIS